MRKGGVYLALGDSITFGTTLTTTTQYGTYAAKIAKAITDSYGQCRLINKAISGWKSADFLTVPYYWSRVDADLVTVHIGTNDCSNSVPVADYQTNIEKTVDLIKDLNPTAEIILCSISRRSDSFANSLDPFRTAVQNAATNKGTLICKFEDAWLQADTGTYTSDQLHPNATGHSKLYDVLWPVIQSTNFVKSLR